MKVLKLKDIKSERNAVMFRGSNIDCPAMSFKYMALGEEEKDYRIPIDAVFEMGERLSDETFIYRLKSLQILGITWKNGKIKYDSENHNWEVKFSKSKPNDWFIIKGDLRPDFFIDGVERICNNHNTLYLTITIQISGKDLKNIIDVYERMLINKSNWELSLVRKKKVMKYGGEKENEDNYAV